MYAHPRFVKSNKKYALLNFKGCIITWCSAQERCCSFDDLQKLCSVLLIRRANMKNVCSDSLMKRMPNLT